MSKPEKGAFFCVANKRIIRDKRLSTNSNGHETVAILEVHDKNQYPTIDEAIVVAQDLAVRYTSDFFVLQAVKVVRRERHPTEVVDLE